MRSDPRHRSESALREFSLRDDGPNWVRVGVEVDQMPTDPMTAGGGWTEPEFSEPDWPSIGGAGVGPGVGGPGAADARVLLGRVGRYPGLPGGGRGTPTSLPQIPDDLPLPIRARPGESRPSGGPGRSGPLGGLPRMRDDEPTGDGSLDEEDRSTGLFESWDWDEAPPTGEPSLDKWTERPSQPLPRAPVRVAPDGGLHAVDDHASLPPEPRPPLVNSITDAVAEEAVGQRAAPPASDPRPVADEVVDWPPPMVRPQVDYPPGWTGDEVGTLIVIDPSNRFRLAERRSGLPVWAVDAAAWTLGFVAMFLTGLVTTGSAALVLFALSL
ncbi:MAG: hypothetical protein ABMB14_17440 [Myxococcota bacterium]